MDSPAFPVPWNVSACELITETFSSRIWKVRREGASPCGNRMFTMMVY